MATRMKTVEVRAGDYMRLHIFPVRNIHRGRRARRFRASSETQSRYNAKMAALRMCDLLHANFTGDDFAVRLSYRGDAPDVKTAEAEMRRFLRRVKYLYAKHGCELKYLAVTEKGKKHGRAHHHIVMNACPALSRRAIEKKWRGYAHIEYLEFDDGEMTFSDGGLTGLSKYVIFDKARETAKRYSRSRNLAAPLIREHIGRFSAKEAAGIAMFGDVSAVEEIYPDYAVRKAGGAEYPADSCGAINCGLDLFCTVWLCRKTKRFNISAYT